ncbi:MAG TPA: Uma2 family endonuclease [Blastocatellia bacterium]|nr:Uma2 family endonuclease [Blastocatellia bacterium]
METNPKRKYTLEEYLALDRESEGRHEFWNGEIFAMSGGSRNHDRIMLNTTYVFLRQLEGKKCHLFSGEMRINVLTAPPYRYSDGSVACEKIEIDEFHGVDRLLNPILIMEILSPSTEAYDRGDKFTFYKSIPSLREYLLIAQHRPHITHYFKQSSDKWEYNEYNDLSDVVTLQSIECRLALSDVCKDVEFKAQLPGLRSTE